jgi:hypothetical protein
MGKNMGYRETTSKNFDRSCEYEVVFPCCFMPQRVADTKLGRRTASKVVILDLTHLKLCVDVASIDLISYWEIWYERCYDAIAMDHPRCVVDVGANIGAFSLYTAMVKNAELVIAFEASPQVFPRLA